MNKFLVFPCIKQEDEKGYNGPAVTLACASNISFALFFPISEENANLINYILEDKEDKKIDMDTSILGIYKTMLDSWRAGYRFLSGILMDVLTDTEEEIIAVKLILSDESGSIDSIIRVNFTHAVILAAMERKEILVTAELLDKIMPDESDDDEDEDIKENDDSKANKTKYPVDKDILEIAKKIMQGKIK